MNFLIKYFKYKHFILKRKVENIFIFPFILIGRLIAVIKPLEKEYEIFYFFPFYHIGGAEKVHAQIAQATGPGNPAENKNSIIYFTRKSHNNLFFEEFKKSGCEIKDISVFTDNKWIHFINLVYRGIISHYINVQKNKPLVFNGQCNFAYKISPWIRKQIPQIELIHSLGTFSCIRIPFIECYYKTVMISQMRIEDHKRLYRQFNIPLKFVDNIFFILNGIPLPSETKSFNIQSVKKLKILYSGRATPEKRVHLVAQVAKKINDTEKQGAEFIFLGDVEEAIPEHLKSYCTFLGYRGEEEFINQVYLDSDILILVSDTEGFAMVIMEAMAFGLTIISTAVGEIPLHVKDNISGFLIYDVNDESKVIQEAINSISTIYNNPSLLKEMGEYNIKYARAHFSLERFNAAYKSLFNQTKKDFEPR